MAKLFEKQHTNFYYNWLSFIEDFLKSFLVCFLMGHSVYRVTKNSTYIGLYNIYNIVYIHYTRIYNACDWNVICLGP